MLLKFGMSFDFFREIMNTIDTITSALGKIFNFIIDSVETVISFLKTRFKILEKLRMDLPGFSG